MKINNNRQLGMYIHIPFCVKKCFYCDFISAPSDDETIDKYVRALIRELEMSATDYKDRTVATIFFGGGTPSILSVKQLKTIIDTIYNNYNVAKNAEITIEANPGTINYDKLAAYREMSFNRISMGLQSVNNNELKVLGRIHTFEQFLEEYGYAKRAGFENINIDLMSAIPDQSYNSYMECLKTVIDLKPQHISAYSLIIEENTPFYNWYNEGEFVGRIVDEETDRQMYHATRRILADAGYERYEISNYAKYDYECRHNLTYWERGDYAGFGVAAASLIDNVRYTNITNVAKYIDSSLGENMLELIRDNMEKLTENDCMEEYMFLGLRKMKGISVQEFFESFGTNIDDIYGKVIEQQIKKGLLIREDNRIYLSETGIDVSNQVMAEFLR